ncbi:MAG: hypothetical protein M3O78_03505 [Chloroflexota bacterium]|nr:hypothetical protein [Chloroflexota bacterium]
MLDRFAVALLSLAAFVLGHDLLFLLASGPSFRIALQQSGHGAVWDTTVMTVIGAAAVLAGLAMRRLVALSQAARALRGPAAALRRRRAHLLGQVLRLWAVILAIALVLLVVNENLERAAIGLPLPGVGVLLPAIPIFAAVALAVAVVAALYGWRRDLLISRLAEACRPWRVATAQTYPQQPWVNRRPGSNVGRRQAGRAPPSLALGR